MNDPNVSSSEGSFKADSDDFKFYNSSGESQPVNNRLQASVSQAAAANHPIEETVEAEPIV